MNMDCGKAFWVLKLIFAMHVVYVFISMKYMQALFYIYIHIYTHTHVCMYICMRVYVCTLFCFLLLNKKRV